MEFYCFLCHDWFPETISEQHFSYTHNRKGLTIDKLKDYAQQLMGGIETRETPKKSPTKSDSETTRKSNWMFPDEDSQEFITSNWIHKNNS